MQMNTKISLELGDKAFDVEVGELTSEQKKSLAEKFNVEQEKVNAYKTIKTEFTELVDMHETNREILQNDESLSLVKKVEMHWEQRGLLLKIKAMRPEVEAKAKEETHFNEIAKEQFNLIVSGVDKTALIKEIDGANTPYTHIINTVLEAVKKEKEKKSSNS